MEKIGVEVEVVTPETKEKKEKKEATPLTKEASSTPRCSHPQEHLLRPDPETTFCTQCGKYLK